jgi:hypothetical protein
VNCARYPVLHCGDCTDKSRSSVHTENVAVAPAAAVTTVQLSELQGALGSVRTCVWRWESAAASSTLTQIAETSTSTSTSQFGQIYGSRDGIYWNANVRYRHFGGTLCLHLQGIKIKLQVYVTPALKWRQYVAPKRWYLPTTGRVMDQKFNCFKPRKLGYALSAVHVGFGAKGVDLGEAFLGALRFPPDSIIQSFLPAYSSTRGVGACAD